MLLKTKGYSHLIESPIVAKVSRTPLSDESPYIFVSPDNMILDNVENSEAILTSLSKESAIDYPSVYGIPSFSHLEDGDIVLINTDGVINSLYRVNSNQNFLLITKRLIGTV